MSTDETYLDRYGDTWARSGVRPAPVAGEPVTAWPGSPLLPLWRQVRDRPELVSIRCGAAGGRCRASLGAVWATPRGLLLHSYVHVAPTRVNVRLNGDDAGLVEEMQREVDEGRSSVRDWAPGRPTAITQGLPDPRGALMLVDDPEQWFGAKVGCLTHAPVVDLDRLDLLTAAESMAARDRRGTFVVNAQR